MNTLRRISFLLTACLLAVVMAISGQIRLSAFVFPTAYATEGESGAIYLDTSDPLDDLRGSIIAGQQFNLEEFSFDTDKDERVMSFIEYGYSFSDSSNLNFYIHIYNPKGVTFKTDSSHYINIRFGLNNESENFESFNLQYINHSAESNFSGLFYKFKLVLTPVKRTEIFNQLNSTSRAYDISEVTLYDISGQAVTVGFGAKFEYSGYMAGFGPDVSADTTLACNVNERTVLSLDVHFTYYRPEGTREGSDYIQDSLHSIYFAVPNEIIEEFGNMTAVHADWYDAVLKPGIVIGDQVDYNHLKSLIGIDEHSAGNDLLLAGNYSRIWDVDIDTAMYSMHYYYGEDCRIVGPYESGSVEVNPLYLVFGTENFKDDSADSYVLSGEKILEEIKTLSNGSTLSNGYFCKSDYLNKYNSDLFSSYNTEKTEITYTVDDEWNLTSERLGESFWEKLFGIKKTTRFDNIKAVYEVSDDDFLLSDSKNAENLFINSSDYVNLKNFYNTNKDDFTIYLFRYQVSDFVSEEASKLSIVYDRLWGTACNYSVDHTNASFFSQTVNLEFDVINLTFTKNDVDTVIPVVMQPQDFVADATPPVNVTSDVDDIWAFLKIILGGLALIFIVQILGPFISPIISAVLSLIWKGIKIVFSAILSVLLFPLRLVGRLLGFKDD